MKKFILFIGLLLGTYNMSAQKVNDKVQIEFDGKWYKGKIEKINDKGLYYVSYDGWDDSFKEWVGKDRLKFAQQTAKPKLEEKVEAKKKN